MSKLFFKKRDRIIQLENENWRLREQIERESFPFQLTVPTFSGEIRFSGSTEAIKELQKHFDMQYKKRPPKPIKGKSDV